MKTARAATLGTIGAQGQPHLVPIVFAFDNSDLVFAVDSKLKTGGGRLARLDNIRRDPHVSVLAHNYGENWDDLWWVRVDGLAAIVEDGKPFESAVIALRERYPQYASTSIKGPAVRIKIRRAIAWRATGP